MKAIKIANQLTLLIIILKTFIFINVECAYRQDAYKIFDKYTLIDLFDNFRTQLSEKACKLTDGPNCYQLSSYEDLENNEYLSAIVEKLKINNVNVDLETVYLRLKNELKKFNTKHKSISETPKFTPKVVMNLLLNFESYDQTTATKDTYMPEEKIVQFNIGFIKLNFKGKLRITADRDDMKPADVNNPPIRSYGVVEERDLELKFDKPVFIKYFYIRPHLRSKAEEDYNQVDFEVSGYYKDNLAFSYQSKIERSKKWTKVHPLQKPVTMIKFPKDFDLDDIHISQDTEEGMGNDTQFASILQGVIEDLIDKNNVENVILEDDN